MRIGNWTALIAALEMAIRMPGLYDQRTWSRLTECGTVRCIAGWIAHFGGWVDGPASATSGEVYTVSNSVHGDTVIECAALISLNLDPEFYGEIPAMDYDTWVEGVGSLPERAEQLAYSLFSGGVRFDDILATVRDLARADGVQLPELIVSEMERLGVPA